VGHWEVVWPAIYLTEIKQKISDADPVGWNAGLGTVVERVDV